MVLCAFPPDTIQAIDFFQERVMSRSGLAEQTIELTPDRLESADAEATRPGFEPIAGSSRELLTLALPLIVSQGFMTVQVFLDTILLAWHDPREMAASFPAVMWFWLLFGLLQVTAGYVSTFVAQYTGAGRPERVGPAVWQGIHFAVLAGLVFLLVVPAAPYLIAIGGHTPALQLLEVIYLRCLVFRRAADAGHGRGQRLFFRARPDLDRAPDRGRRNRGQRGLGSCPDLRPGRISRAGNRGGRLGNRDWVVDVGPVGFGALAAAEISHAIPHFKRLAAGA